MQLNYTASRYATTVIVVSSTGHTISLAMGGNVTNDRRKLEMISPDMRELLCVVRACKYNKDTGSTRSAATDSILIVFFPNSPPKISQLLNHATLNVAINIASVIYT